MYDNNESQDNNNYSFPWCSVSRDCSRIQWRRWRVREETATASAGRTATTRRCPRGKPSGKLTRNRTWLAAPSPVPSSTGSLPTVLWLSAVCFRRRTPSCCFFSSCSCHGCVLRCSCFRFSSDAATRLATDSISTHRTQNTRVNFRSRL